MAVIHGYMSAGNFRILRDTLMEGSNLVTLIFVVAAVFVFLQLQKRAWKAHRP